MGVNPSPLCITRRRWVSTRIISLSGLSACGVLSWFTSRLRPPSLKPGARSLKTDALWPIFMAFATLQVQRPKLMRHITEKRTIALWTLLCSAFHRSEFLHFFLVFRWQLLAPCAHCHLANYMVASRCCTGRNTCG